jgi:Uma2 family endonuclease
MVTATPGKLLTAEEFAELPDPADGTKQELVRGVVVSMPPPKPLHGFVTLKVGRAIGNFVEEHSLGLTFSNDPGVILERKPDTVRGPDVAFWSFKRQAGIPKGYFEVPPDLAVEVLSPSNTPKKVKQKLKEYFFAGTPLVWVVDPDRRSVFVYRDPEEGRVLHEDKSLDGEDVLPGFSCPVAYFFPPPDPESD